jgi:hypothetical protein
MGGPSADAMASNRDRFRPVSQPTANWDRVEQNDVHQQLRVFREASNSEARSTRSSTPRGRTCQAGWSTSAR